MRFVLTRSAFRLDSRWLLIGALAWLLALSTPAGADAGRFVYVANTADHTLSQFAVQADGSLTPLSPATVATGHTPRGVAVSRDGRTVYTTNTDDSTVGQFDVGANGALTPKTPATLFSGNGAQGITLAPNGRFAYVINRADSNVAVFSIAPDGRLTRIAVAPVGEVQDLVISHDGSIAYLSGLNQIAIYRIAADGNLTPNSPATAPAGGAVGDLTLSPDGASLYAIGTPGLMQFSVASNGGLAAKSPHIVPTNLFAGWAAITPDGSSFYVTTGSASPTVDQFTVRADGTLEPKSPTFANIQINPTHIIVSPDGRSVYVSVTRGNFVAQYDVSAGGLLEDELGFTTGRFPAALAMTPDSDPPDTDCGAADGAWHADNVTVTCRASDDYSGLQDPAHVEFALTTSVPAGQTQANAATNAVTVCDRSGNCATAGPVTGIKVDRAGPDVSCDGADGQWHPDNVSFACSATDAGSGLQNPGDQSFVLSTTVADGAFDGDASTLSRRVCDAVAHCVTAGPVEHVRVDRAAPHATCAIPDAQWHAENVSFACTAADAGSGLADPADAAFLLTTSVPAGTHDSNASTAARTVCDHTGHCVNAGPIGPVRVDRRDPQITLTSPVNGRSYSLLATLLAPVRVSYTCTDNGGSGVVSCTGTQPSGAILPTGLFNLGPHTFTVTAVDAVGRTTTVTHSYQVTL